MFEDRTPEALQAEMVAGMGGVVQTREGSFVREMVGPVATEMAKIYQVIPGLLSAIFVDETSGAFIDIACSRYGIIRKSGTYATAVMRLEGRAGVTIPAGAIFVTAQGLEFALDADVTLDEQGSGTGTVTATAVGDAYNVAAGEMSQMVVTMTGLSKWSNEAAEGGTDAETDAALVGRLYDYWRKPSTSGNVYDYEQWALETDGVGGCKVQPRWNGPGTVKVLLISAEREPVDDTVVAAAAAYIEEQRPVGADVTVESAGGVAIDVSVTLSLDGSVSLSDITAELTDRLRAYLQSVAFVTDTVRYNRIAFLILDIDGVVDYTDLTVNGGTDNIPLAEEDVPVMGEVVVG